MQFLTMFGEKVLTKLCWQKLGEAWPAEKRVQISQRIGYLTFRFDSNSTKQRQPYIQRPSIWALQTEGESFFGKARQKDWRHKAKLLKTITWL